MSNLIMSISLNIVQSVATDLFKSMKKNNYNILVQNHALACSVGYSYTN